MIYENDHLLHYGVKGMRWGVRRIKASTVRAMKKQTKQDERSVKYYKKITDKNAKALEKSKSHDEKNLKPGQTSWTTHALTDAHKAAGRSWVESMIRRDIDKAYVDALKKDEIKAGKDYVKNGLGIELTDSGVKKRNQINDRVFEEGVKKYADEIKKYK